VNSHCVFSKKGLTRSSLPIQSLEKLNWSVTASTHDIAAFATHGKTLATSLAVSQNVFANGTSKIPVAILSNESFVD
jgi:hypothetical protein